MPQYFSQLGEDCLLAQFFEFKTCGFFIDVGAFDGIYLSNTYFFERLGWSGVCVEAFPPYFNLCVRNRPGSKCHHAACLDGDRGAVEFRAERGGLFCGIEVDENAVANYYRSAAVPFDGFRSIKVPSTSLDALLPDGVGEIDFASIDVEGAELQVLDGFDLERYRPRVLVIEANTPAQRQAVDDHLGPRGYVAARSMAWNHFYVRTPADARALRGIEVKTDLERPPHPLGRLYNRVGDAVPQRVHWPALGAGLTGVIDATGSIGRSSQPSGTRIHRGNGGAMLPVKAAESDHIGRFREIISDPLNLLIERVPMAGVVDGTDVFLHNGNRVPLAGEGAYYGAFSEILILNRGVHEPLEEYVFQEMLKKLRENPVMIELGAYWAHYSMWLKKFRPGATPILVEPDPVNLAAGTSNFQRNGFTGEFINAAVATGQFEVDRFLASRELSHLDILHADIQGFEVQMLGAARAALAEKKIDYLFISTHSQELHGEVVRTLGAHGYRIEVSSDVDNDTTSFDGFVFASSPGAGQIFRWFVPFGRTKIAEGPAERMIEAILAARGSVV